MAAAYVDGDEIVCEFLSVIRVYKNGRIVRTNRESAITATLDAATGVDSKDVVIDPATGVMARLYLPVADKKEKLPVVIYFHAGGFFACSTLAPMYHNYLNALSCRARVLVVSVEYRLAPEHPIPAAYHDAASAFDWVLSGGRSDGWLADHADLSRVFLAGDSAGGNIAHNLAIGSLGAPKAVEGVVMVHSAFWGTERTAAEAARGASSMVLTTELADRIWPFVSPDSPSNDDPRMNPFVAGAPSLRGLACRRVLVAVAEMDVMADRQRAYVEKLRESGWGGEAELVESAGEDHCFHLYNPGDGVAAEELTAQLVRFFNDK